MHNPKKHQPFARLSPLASRFSLLATRFSPLATRFSLLAAALLAIVVSRVAVADLAPAEIAIVAANGSRESKALASYYAKQRKVPAENICLIDVPAGETLPRDVWENSVRPQIRKWLAARVEP